MNLNIGCGNSKLTDYINIDIDADLKPDLVCDVANSALPYDSDSVDEVVFLHTIEHIHRERHPFVIGEINRVLRINGTFLIAFPDALKVVTNFINNKWGLRDYWEKAICGRGLTIWDCHRSLIHTDDFIPFLREMGFYHFKVMEEVGQSHNAIIRAKKTFSVIERTELLKKELKLEISAANGAT